MLTIKFTKQFHKDLKLVQKRGYNDLQLLEVINLLAEQKPLPAYYHDHVLVGKYKGCRECHIQPDWLLIYEIKKNELLLILTRTGTHSDVF